ncbi:type II toxin-antitoxin system PemI/MazE family antitoxin [Lentilactobacillus parakefiri]|uniref:Toxin-antitoxin addiction module regulator MazE n=1 Tax=Lentilactobacillus parakefiri TaxID=152332 RepID=A0A269Y791_9LACO|nr:hypothetical protein [Lentilactobacillus parakefiri]KRL70904.1 hypothetical protein FD08_GL000922 [Lentilactobacillus parakefiri DSM 10551]PAK81417.1 hypothetical protein B8W98_07780 [Lentilactobacillus parakefiri]PAK99671.1 hypothetical protein B8W96_10435 [Lentilactobacillus parakefiri]TDG94550.1 hypothetical protein C5L28_000807 [Lentilactobacillus parakefiri]GAW72178.1 toxin-antitoxin addiction module regulator MazE [Lentilactobacillus parakefiri]
MKKTELNQPLKVYKQGELTVITLPQSFDIPIGQEFYATKQDSGAIVLTPQVEDYFTSDKYNFRQSESYRPEGKEWRC